MDDNYYSMVSIEIENRNKEEYLLRSKVLDDKVNGSKRVELIVSNVQDNFEGLYEASTEKDLNDSLNAFKSGNSGIKCGKYVFNLEEDGNEMKLCWKMIKILDDEEMIHSIDSVPLTKVGQRDTLFSLLKEVMSVLKEKDLTIEKLKDNSLKEPVTSAPFASSTKGRINQWTRLNRRKYGLIRPIGSESIENSNVSQRNLKQKLIHLLKRFKVPDTEGFELEEQYKKALEQGLIPASASNDENDIDDDLFDDDIGDWSDNGQEFDEISISSTPKPSLRPYFSTWTLEGQNQERHDSPRETGNEQTPDTSDASLKQDEKVNDKKSSKLRRILGKKDSANKNTQVRNKK